MCCFWRSIRKIVVVYKFGYVTFSETIIVILSVCFNGHFPGGAGLVGTRMSPFWILLELRVMEVVSDNNWSYKTCKAPVKMSSPTNQNPVLFTGRLPFLSPNQQCSTEQHWRWNHQTTTKGDHHFCYDSFVFVDNLDYGRNLCIIWWHKWWCSSMVWKAKTILIIPDTLLSTKFRQGTVRFQHQPGNSNRLYIIIYVHRISHTGASF